MNDDPTMRLLTSSEVCARLRISRRTLYRLTGSLQMPFVRVGGQLRFVEATLQTWLDSRARGPHAVTEGRSADAPDRRDSQGRRHE